eukprot:jgi/Mesen1/11038/ME000098S10435
MASSILMRTSISSAALFCAQGRGPRCLPSTPGNLFVKSRLRYSPRKDGERDVFCTASHPRPVFPPAPKLPAPEQKQAALDACREVNPSASLALVLHAQERRLRILSAALERRRHFTSTHPRPLFPANILPPVDDRKAAQRAARATRAARSQTLRELNSRRQQRRSQAARIKRAAASVATPPLGALFGPPAPPAAPTRAARQNAQAAARSAAQAVEKGVAGALAPPSRMRAAPFATRDSSLPCVKKKKKKHAPSRGRKRRKAETGPRKMIAREDGKSASKFTILKECIKGKLELGGKGPRQAILFAGLHDGNHLPAACQLSVRYDAAPAVRRSQALELCSGR